MSFFIRNRGKNKTLGEKRKVGKKTPFPSKKDEPAVKRRRGGSDDEILSDSDIDSDQEVTKKEEYLTSEEDEDETAQEKRLRLAKEYLGRLQTEEDEENELKETHRDAIAHRLKQDVLEQAGKLHKQIAQDISAPSESEIRILKGHQLPITCMVISPDDKHVFSAGKDCSIIKWNVETGKKEFVIHGGRKGTEKKHIGHTAHILCLAISTDGKYLASGDRNKLIHIWDPSTCKLVHTFIGHRGPVTGLAFRKGTHQLFSASGDKTVKIWSVDEMAYVETLFGHQDEITGIDSLTRERCITCGGRDGSIRIWKVVEESQLIFHGNKGSIDCVALINEEHFISGSDDNSISLWGVNKKKPLVTVKNAHLHEEGSGVTQGSEVKGENWMTAVTSLQHSDLVATGSKDGCVRLWKCGPNFKTLELLHKIPIVGFVNSLKFSSDGKFLVAGVGQEHRLGRWWRLKNARNSIHIIPIHHNKN